MEVSIIYLGANTIKQLLTFHRKTPCFTVHYAAPEVIDQALGQNEEGYDASCDIWSLGTILVSEVTI